SDPLAAPKMGIEQAKDFYNHPGEFIGKNLIHGTEALAGGAVGGEAAAGARGLLGDLTGTETRALTHGLDDAAPGHPPTPHSAEPHTPTGSDHTPISGDHSAVSGHPVSGG
ncbi:HNH endonuclease, partial [Mycobacteroides abscessus subsp. abscessus]